MTDAPDDAPFDPYAFPSDLINAQRAAVEAYQALRDYQVAMCVSRDVVSTRVGESHAHADSGCTRERALAHFSWSRHAE
jgi:hypothetical protein